MTQPQPRDQGSLRNEAQPRTELFPTQNHLPEDVRTSIISMLNRTLADTTVLLTQAKFAHWNLKGSQFYSLHLLFDEIAETFEQHADDIGERITALGGKAMGTAAMATANSRVPRMPTDAVTGQEYVEILADRLAVHDTALSGAIDAAEDLGDLDTADLLTEVSREVSKHLWFLEAHLQTQPIGTFQGSDSPQSAVGQQSQAFQGMGDDFSTM